MLGNARYTGTVPASDMDRARKFYEEVLGCKAGEEDPGGITMKCGAGTSFYLFNSTGAGTSKATVGGWDVDDLEKTMEELRAKGVVFEEYDTPELKTVNGIADWGGYKGAWFKDSEGNILGLGQGSK